MYSGFYTLSREELAPLREQPSSHLDRSGRLEGITHFLQSLRNPEFIARVQRNPELATRLLAFLDNIRSHLYDDPPSRSRLNNRVYRLR